MVAQKRSAIAVALVMVLFSVFTSKTRGTEQNGNCNGGKEECPRKRMQLQLPLLDGVEVGHTQEIELQAGRKHTLKTLSLKPPVFEISNFFSDDECEFVIDMAQKRGLRESQLATDDADISDETSRKRFDDLDTNKDGQVDIEEFIYMPGKSDLYFTDEDIKEMFTKLSLDKDGDDKMSFMEFEQVTAQKIKSYFLELRQVRSSLRSRTSSYTWLWHDDDDLLEYEDVLEDYHLRFSKLTKLPEKIIEQSEPLQVVRYGENGHYHCHQDSEVVNRQVPCCTYGKKDCRLCRYITVMVYLNDVEDGGQSAFPLADNQTFSWDAWGRNSNVQCNLAKHCDKSNLIIKPAKGKAILWYNHKQDGATGWMGVHDPLSFHGECQVTKGNKWVANMWINVIGDGSETLSAWKMGNNWLSSNNRNQEIIESFEQKLIEIEQEPKENRFTKERNPMKISGHLDDAIELLEDAHRNVPTHKEGAIKPDHSPVIEIIDGKAVHNVPAAKNEPNELNSDTDIEILEDELINKIPAPEEGPTGPDPSPVYNAAPLPLPKERLYPQGPKENLSVRPLPPPNVEGNRIVQSILILLQELDNPELEIIARVLHDKLKLVCVPLIMNPMGTM